MAELTNSQINLCVSAFETAWLSLLRNKRVRDNNIKKLPTLLMAAILEHAAKGGLNKDALAAAGLERVKGLKEEIKE